MVRVLYYRLPTAHHKDVKQCSQQLHRQYGTHQLDALLLDDCPSLRKSRGGDIYVAISAVLTLGLAIFRDVEDDAGEDGVFRTASKAWGFPLATWTGEAGGVGAAMETSEALCRRGKMGLMNNQ